jgi:lipoprotein LprA
MTNRLSRRTFLRTSAVGLSAAAFGPVLASADEEADQLLRAAAEALAKIKTFHFEMKTLDGRATVLDNLELKSVAGDVVRPDSFQATLTASLAVIDVSVDVVSIGGAVWVTDPTKSGTVWRQIATGGERGGAGAFTDLINPDRLFLAAIALIDDPKVDGTEEIDGEQCTVVTGMFDPARLEDLASPSAGEVDTTSILTGEPVYLTTWIAEDGRVLRIEEEGPLTESESNDVVRAITFSAFDDPLEITAPE